LQQARPDLNQGGLCWLGLKLPTEETQSAGTIAILVVHANALRIAAQA
jgi:hypothetical protein